jgi:hypothetical protein
MRISPRGTSSSRASVLSTSACGTAIVSMPSWTMPMFSKMPVTSQLTQPETLAICQASGSAGRDDAGADRAVAPEDDADRRGRDEQQRVHRRERQHEAGDEAACGAAIAPVCWSITSRTYGVLVAARGRTA